MYIYIYYVYVYSYVYYFISKTYFNVSDFAEDIIWNFPRMVNQFRNRTITYEPMTAFKLMRDHNLMTESHLTYELSTQPFTVFSKSGMSDLHRGIEKLILSKSVGVYVCEPYTFLIGSLNGNLFLLDTHPVPSKFGGTNTALLVSTEGTKEGSVAVCKWLWKCIYESNVCETNNQSLSAIVLDPKLR